MVYVAGHHNTDCPSELEGLLALLLALMLIDVDFELWAIRGGLFLGQTPVDSIESIIDRFR